MKIKTITGRLNYPGTFDAEVNEAQEEGWHLVKRAVLPGTPGGSDYPRLLYAELVQLDPEPEEPPEAQPLGPIEALHVVRDFCSGVSAVDCHAGKCPLYSWCHHLRDGGDPTDWELPGEGG